VRHWAWILLLLAPGAASERVERLEVGHEGGTYSVQFRVALQAPASAVYRVLTDFDAIHELTPGIQSSKSVGRTEAGRQRVRNTLEGCVLSFCRRMVQQWVVREPGGGRILTRIEPDPSDFSSGWALWRVRSAGNGTMLYYRAELTPSFWVPPLVGPWLIEKNMSDNLRTLAARVEARAAGED
jgi:hypothetical protein